MMENQLRRTILVIPLCLLFAILGVVPEVHFTVLASTHTNLLVGRVPVKACNLAFVEGHLIQEVLRHSDVPNSDPTIFSCTCKHVLVDIVKSATVQRFFSDLTL